MTRSKTRPSIRKPVFDEESILSFAAHTTGPVGTAVEQSAGSDLVGKSAVRKSVKETKMDRQRIILMLKREVIIHLENEAARKEKSIDQIVEKLVTKHLGKH
jgi:hypothetical protein